MYHQKMSSGAALLFSVLLITIVSSINNVDAGRSPAAMKKTATLTPELFLDSDQELGIEVTKRDYGPRLGGPLATVNFPEAAETVAEEAAAAAAATEAAAKKAADAAAAAAAIAKEAADAAAKTAATTKEAAATAAKEAADAAAAAAAAAKEATEAATIKAAEAAAAAKKAAEVAAAAAAATKEAAEAAAKATADAAAAAATTTKAAAAVKTLVETTNALLKGIPETDKETLTKLGQINGLTVDVGLHFTIITLGKTDDQIKETIRQVNIVLNP